MNFVKEFKRVAPLKEREHGFMVVQRCYAGARFGALQLVGKDRRATTFYFLSKKEVHPYQSHQVIVGFNALRSIIVEGIVYKSPRNPKQRYVVPVNEYFDDDRAWSPDQEFMFCVFEAIIETCIKNKIQNLEDSDSNSTWNGFPFDENLIRAIECIAQLKIQELIEISLSISD
jgi:hypothetical protein